MQWDHIKDRNFIRQVLETKIALMQVLCVVDILKLSTITSVSVCACCCPQPKLKYIIYISDVQALRIMLQPQFFYLNSISKFVNRFHVCNIWLSVFSMHLIIAAKNAIRVCS